MRLTQQSTNPFHRFIFFLTVGSLFFVLSQLHAYTSNNVTSRFATIESLVHRGTYSIDAASFPTIDQYQLNGITYSSKPPLFPTMLAGLYKGYALITGNTFQTNRDAAVIFVKSIPVVLSHLMLLTYAVLFLRAFSRNTVAQVLVFASIAYSYLGIAYAGDLNNHTVAAALAIGMLYHVYTVARGRVTSGTLAFWIHSLLGGVWAGFLMTIDIPSTALVMVTGGYLLLHNRRAFALFLTVAIIPFLIQSLLYYSINNTILPAQVIKKDVQPNDYWSNPIGIDAATDSRWTYFIHMTVGHHGIFAFTPALLFGLWGLLSLLFGKGMRKESLVILAGFTAMFLYYLLRTRNYGGVCVGFRWLIPIMPAILLFAVYPLERALARSTVTRSLVILLFLVCIGIGFTQNYLNRGDPWRHSLWHSFLGPYLQQSYL